MPVLPPALTTRPSLDRRQFLGGVGLGTAALWTGLGTGAMAQRRPAKLQSYPFTLGVAAGDPDATGFVIWTRLAPQPDAPLSGLQPAAYPVVWEVSEDPNFTRITQSGEALARPELGYSVHVTLSGLQPQRPYHYRFRLDDMTSATGRARTLPALGAQVQKVRLGVGGCQHYEQGLYTAWKDLAAQDLDAVFHYGDYIYEGGTSPSRFDWNQQALVANVRLHTGEMTYSLDDYRRRYTQARQDPDMQAAHASAAFLCSFDDHEIINNWVGDYDMQRIPPEIFRLRRQAAMQAWYEFMPVRADALPRDGVSGPYRQYRFGQLLDARLLNTRNWRTDQPCNDRFGTWCEAVNDPKAEVLGKAQEDWLVAGLNKNPARWNSLLQQIMVMDLDRVRDETAKAINTDSWAAYTHPRDRLLDRLAKVPNLVVLTGDEHQHYAGEIRKTDEPIEKPARAIEFVTTSISSGGDGPGERAEHKDWLRRNPGLKYIRDMRGYSLCTITPDSFEVEMKEVESVRRPNAKVLGGAKWVVPAGACRLERA